MLSLAQFALWIGIDAFVATSQIPDAGKRLPRTAVIVLIFEQVNFRALICVAVVQSATEHHANIFRIDCDIKIRFSYDSSRLFGVSRENLRIASRQLVRSP